MHNKEGHFRKVFPKRKRGKIKVMGARMRILQASFQDFGGDIVLSIFVISPDYSSKLISLAIVITSRR